MSSNIIIGERVLIKLEDRTKIGKGGVILSGITDDLLKGKVISSGISDISKNDMVFFKKFGSIKYEDMLVIDKKDLVIKLKD